MQETEQQQPETKPPVPPFTEETARQKVKMAEDAWGYHRHALLTAAAAIYNRTGSLELVASALCWTGFQAPFDASEEALQEWIEDNRDQILGLTCSTPALTIAHGEMYEKDD